MNKTEFDRLFTTRAAPGGTVATKPQRILMMLGWTKSEGVWSRKMTTNEIKFCVTVGVHELVIITVDDWASPGLTTGVIVRNETHVEFDESFAGNTVLIPRVAERPARLAVAPLSLRNRPEETGPAYSTTAVYGRVSNTFLLE